MQRRPFAVSERLQTVRGLAAHVEVGEELGGRIGEREARSAVAGMHRRRAPHLGDPGAIDDAHAGDAVTDVALELQPRGAAVGVRAPAEGDLIRSTSDAQDRPVSRDGVGERRQAHNALSGLRELALELLDVALATSALHDEEVRRDLRALLRARSASRGR